MREGDLVVAALVAVNAFGDIDDGAPVADRFAGIGPDAEASTAFGNTTIGLIVTNAALSKVACHLVAQGGHDAFARALVPSHTRVDGDAVVAAATGSFAGEAPVDLVRLLAVAAMEQAVRAGGA
jgi:L-aminopeptidase/D-esterase-like protein